MLSSRCTLGWNWTSAFSIALLLLGFLVSFYLGDLEQNNRRIRSVLKKRKSGE